MRRLRRAHAAWGRRGEVGRVVDPPPRPPPPRPPDGVRQSQRRGWTADARRLKCRKRTSSCATPAAHFFSFFSFFFEKEGMRNFFFFFSLLMSGASSLVGELCKHDAGDVARRGEHRTTSTGRRQQDDVRAGKWNVLRRAEHAN